MRKITLRPLADQAAIIKFNRLKYINSLTSSIYLTFAQLI